MEKIKPLENQKIRDEQFKVIGEQAPFNGKIQNKINEIIKKLNEIIKVINNGKNKN